MIVAQVQQMKMFNAQFEKEMRVEGRKNRKMVEKVMCLMLMLMFLPPLLIILKKITRMHCSAGGRKSDSVEKLCGRVESRGEAG